MAEYILNKHQQRNGDFEIHRTDICPFLPEPENQIYLGDFNNGSEALKVAVQRWPQLATLIDGCKFCCTECHRH